MNNIFKKNIKTCIYCKAVLAKSSNNAEDFGLHAETAGMYCCSECDKLITLTNRYLSQVINARVNNDQKSEKRNLALAIENLQELFSEENAAQKSRKNIYKFQENNTAGQ